MVVLGELVLDELRMPLHQTVDVFTANHSPYRHIKNALRLLHWVLGLQETIVVTVIVVVYIYFVICDIQESFSIE